MEEKRRLSLVIEHWIEHNQGHIGEYRRWALKARDLNLKEVNHQIEEADGKAFAGQSSLRKGDEGVKLFIGGGVASER